MIIWPSNIDRSKSRKNGRIIPKRISIKVPKLSQMEEAARRLGLNPEIEQEKAYPRFWWEKSGRIVVDKKAPKTEVAKQIVEIIKEL